MKSALELHVGHQVSSLALVRGDDPDLVRLDTRFDEPGEMRVKQVQ